MKNSKQTVFVGLSGGVDSSVAALRLKKAGYSVVGVFIKVWHPDFMVCNWEQERLDAMRVAAHLDIPFLTCDAEEAYKKGVADYFIAEYIAGRTPNPDVMCNQIVKFGAFLEFALAKGADYIATGHYVQNIDGKMYRGEDINKDQSYFLWSLTNSQLEKALFPVGNSPKEKIRKEALAAGMPTAQKKDSQGICFLGHVDIPEFLSHYVDLVPGNVLDTTGATVGTHTGALVYTVGQRHGFSITTKDTARTEMFVVGKDLVQNTITVAPKPLLTDEKQTFLHSLQLRESLSVDITYTAQFRYRQVPLTIKINECTETTMSISFQEVVEKPAAGQSLVIYSGKRCVGGGIIS